MLNNMGNASEHAIFMIHPFDFLKKTLFKLQN